jgi:hypothetical protein
MLVSLLYRKISPSPTLGCVAFTHATLSDYSVIHFLFCFFRHFDCSVFLSSHIDVCWTIQILKNVFQAECMQFVTDHEISSEISQRIM